MAVSGSLAPETMSAQTTPPPAPTFQRRYLFWIALALLAWTAYTWLGAATGRTAIPYSEFKAAVRDGKVAEVTVEGQRVAGTYVDGPAPAGGVGTGEADEKPEPEKFLTTIPAFGDDGLMELLESHDVTVEATPPEPRFNFLLVAMLPLLLLFALMLYAGRTMRQQLGDVGSRLTGFGQSRAKRYEAGPSHVTFDDVAGLENAKKEVREIVEFLKAPERFQRLGVKNPRGILLMGPPGTGKTLLAKAVAGEAGVPFFSISGSEFVEMFVGVGASRVRDMFENAKKEAPAILFVDEIDSVGRARGAGLGGGHDEREQTLNQILAEMDGFASDEAVVVMAATNRPDVLDPALLRPGRFDRKITLELPHKEARKLILEVHSRKVPLADTVDLGELATATVGFSGADLENLVNEAALLAARKNKNHVGKDDFTEARERILFGSEREGMILDEEKKVIAYHEAGHALVAWLLPGSDPLKKVTIIPRGRALGLTEQMPAEDRHNVARTYLMNRIAVMLGGRSAEKVVFGEVSSGAEQDLKQVTQLARRMVCQWGMSEELAPVSFRHGEEHVFLGREMAQAKDFSEHTARIIDREIATIARDMENKALDLLKKHREDLDALAEALLERETLVADEIDELLGRPQESRREALAGT
jgi:cell division protease FtsH